MLLIKHAIELPQKAKRERETESDRERERQRETEREGERERAREREREREKERGGAGSGRGLCLNCLNAPMFERQLFKPRDPSDESCLNRLNMFKPIKLNMKRNV